MGKVNRIIIILRSVVKGQARVVLTVAIVGWPNVARIIAVGNRVYVEANWISELSRILIFKCFLRF